jgi:hypothetical protein
MDPLEKEARIRLYMEKIKKEEEENKKARLSQEKKFLENESQKELEKEIFKSSKNRIALNKIEECLKSNNWVGIIEQLNECLFECGYKRLLTTHDDYSKMNKRAGDMIKNDIENPYDFKTKKDYIEKITCNEYGFDGGFYEKNKHNLDYNINRMSALKSFNEVIDRFVNFGNINFFYYETFMFVKKEIAKFLKKYNPDGFYMI